LRPRGEVLGLLDHALGRFVESVAVAIRAIHHAGRHNRITALANFEVVRSSNDFFGARRSVG
jgi:hypothetical protein